MTAELPDSGSPDTSCKTLNPEAGALVLLEAPAKFCPDTHGSGIFGEWGMDERGLPEYRYTMDQTTDRRARYFNSEGDGRTDHWHMIGNQRVIAMAHNGGYVELYHSDRGAKLMNWYDPENGNFAGGFAFIEDGGEIAGTRYDDARGALIERRFQMNSFETVARKNGLTILRRTYAPAGDHPALVTEVTLTNETSAEKNIRYFEYWDSNQYQLSFGLAGGDFAEPLREERRSFMGKFDVDSMFDEATGALAVVQKARDGATTAEPGDPNDHDWYPPSSFSAFFEFTPDAHFSDQDAFFGAGGIEKPDAVASGSDASSLYSGPGAGQKAALILRKNFAVPPNGRVTFHTIFGSFDGAAGESVESVLGALRADADAFSWDAQGKRQTAPGVFFASSEPAWLTREVAWHASSLNALVSYDGAFRTRTINQGSAYLFIQGLNGAVRDIALATLPMIYLDPQVARDAIAYMLRMTYPDGRIGYATVGYKKLTGAVIHENPSDLDLFLLWALAEYLTATRDYGFLDDVQPYYPDITTNATVREHARKALEHFRDKVGTGPHGLARVLDGDWNDGIILRSPDPEVTREKGESVFNSAMACFVLPTAAEAFLGRDDETSGMAAELAAEHCEALKGAWAVDRFLRGWTDPDTPIGGTDAIYLEPQPFALLSGTATAEQRTALARTIKTALEEPSAIGQYQMYPPSEIGASIQEKGSDTNGGVWHALNGLLTWAYATVDSELGWSSFQRNSMARHAEAYPEIWYGIWSGPDAFNAAYHARPGETFLHLATPMVDFPVMNSNQHAAPLLALIKSLGMTPTRDGLTIAPLWKTRPFVLRTPLVGVAYTKNDAAVYYRPPVDSGEILIRMMPPKPGAGWTVRVNGTPVQTALDASGLLPIPANCPAKTGCTVEIR
ncbi:MAG: hypothetical protein HY897_09680 [Deltaproteobacteria bacterium]|nr:hypothetical protein [Deltaproteobacteria bacterium]